MKIRITLSQLLLASTLVMMAAVTWMAWQKRFPSCGECGGRITETNVVIRQRPESPRYLLIQSDPEAWREIEWRIRTCGDCRTIFWYGPRPD